jgi:hypothetical protein
MILESGVETTFCNDVVSSLTLASRVIHNQDNLSISIVLNIVLCSIIPAVKTITSTHHKRATYDQIYFTSELIYISKAREHCLFHCSTQATISLISLDTQETPSNQLCLLRRSSICAADIDSCVIRYVIIAGSIFPDLVPIINHSNGVIPIEVSRTLPFFIAAILAQLPI